MQEPRPNRVLQFVQENTKPFVTTAEAAAEFPEVSSKTVRDRLNTLEERGEIEVCQVGANSKVWYIADYSRDARESRSLPVSDSQ